MLQVRGDSCRYITQRLVVAQIIYSMLLKVGKIFHRKVVIRILIILRMRGHCPYWMCASVFTVIHWAKCVATSFGNFWTTECQWMILLLMNMDQRALSVQNSPTPMPFALAVCRFSATNAYLRKHGALNVSSSWQARYLCNHLKLHAIMFFRTLADSE